MTGPHLSKKLNSKAAYALEKHGGMASAAMVMSLLSTVYASEFYLQVAPPLALRVALRMFSSGMFNWTELIPLSIPASLPYVQYVLTTFTDGVLIYYNIQGLSVSYTVRDTFCFILQISSLFSAQQMSLLGATHS